MHPRIFFIVAVILQIICLAQNTEFIADVVITGSNINGKLTGTIYFSKAQQATHISYKSGYEEIAKYDVNSKNDLFVYKKCPAKCDVSPQDPLAVLPAYYYESTDDCSSTASGTSLSGSCFLCTKKSNNPVESICLKDMNSKEIVKATHKDGKILDFSNVKSGVTAAHFDSSSWGCVLNCVAQVDIVLIVDESDSISGNYIPGNVDCCEWSQVRSFAKKFVQGFEIAADKVHMGLVQFAKGSHSIILEPPYIISDSVDYNKYIDGLTKSVCGWNNPKEWSSRTEASYCRQRTWTGYGILDAINILKNTDGPRVLRKDVGKIIVIVTDGNDNNDNPFTKDGKSWANPTDWIQYGIDNNIKTVAVGVGDDVSLSYLNTIASTGPDGNKLSFLAATFNDLTSEKLIKELGRVVCTATGTTQNSCPSCKGQCICGTCTCPDSCDIDNKCTQGVCDANTNDQGGCLYKKINCDDGSKCTKDECDPKIGCVHTNITCDDGDKCSNDFCDPKIGCTKSEKDCSNADKCLRSKCDSSTGSCTTPVNICTDKNKCTKDNCLANGTCTFTPIDCTDGNKCVISDCDPSIGCSKLTKNCDDGNKCSTDSCNPADGKCYNNPIICDDKDACTEDTCDPQVGCVHTQLNASTYCYDGNQCTKGMCDSKKGCYHEDVECESIYNDTCIEVMCDRIKGCVAFPVECNNTDSCYVSYCSKGKCIDEQIESCRLASLIGITAGASIGLGALVAIIIAAVVCAGAATGGAVAGYRHVHQGDFTNKNPLYETSTVKNINPAYNRNSVFNTPPVGTDAQATNDIQATNDAQANNAQANNDVA
jgi:hypothetical protein